MQDELVHVLGIEVEDAGLVMVDPDDGMIVAGHDGLLRRGWRHGATNSTGAVGPVCRSGVAG
jgi:hypothetical protein